MPINFVPVTCWCTDNLTFYNILYDKQVQHFDAEKLNFWGGTHDFVKVVINRKVTCGTCLKSELICVKPVHHLWVLFSILGLHMHQLPSSCPGTHFLINAHFHVAKNNTWSINVHIGKNCFLMNLSKVRNFLSTISNHMWH